MKMMTFHSHSGRARSSRSASLVRHGHIGSGTESRLHARAASLAAGVTRSVKTAGAYIVDESPMLLTGSIVGALLAVVTTIGLDARVSF